ncbi:MAG TPA: hypothetical protein VK178_06050 [Opitutaceae bacterium]|nr:hypothetical protein [Opitutaceae bacterium]
MKAPVLIVRTVSVEKLSAVLDACRSRWPEHPLVVVTNPGRLGELRADPRIAEVVSYATGADGFSEAIEYPEPLAAVVVPVGNRDGSGYANVMRACCGLRPASWYLASYSRTLIPVTRSGWSLRWWTEILLGYPARWLGRCWAAWIRHTTR